MVGTHLSNMPMTEEILFEINDGVARVTFNRPDQHNAINFDGWKKLIQIVEEIKNNQNCKVVIFTGSGGKSFSSGADIKDFETNRKDSVSAQNYSEYFDGALDAIESLSIPTISKINGICVGGGCELSMATDIRIASTKSKFGIPVAKLGILVGYREMKRLLNLVGPGNASYVLLSGRIFDSTTALSMGMITQMCEENDLDAIVEKLAEEMLPLAPLSQERHKKILQTVINNQSLENLSEDDSFLPFSNFDSLDFQEGRQSFIERRPPNFKGE